MSTFYKYRNLENWNDLFVKVPVKSIMVTTNDIYRLKVKKLPNA